MTYKNDLEILEEYLDGGLSELEMKEFEATLSTDPELRKELELLKLSKESIQLSSWKNLISETQSSYLKSRKSDLRNQMGIWGWARKIAASLTLILLLSSVVFYTTISPKSLTDDFIEYQIPVMRGDAKILSDLEKAYQEKDFDSVEKMRDKFSSEDPKASFILAMVDLKNNKASSAEQHLKRIEIFNQTADNPIFKDEVSYYLVQALLNQNKFKEAESRMDQIKSNPRNKYAKNFTSWDLWKLKLLKIKR